MHDEVADKVWMPISEVKDLLRENRTMDGVSMLAILFALEFYKYERKWKKSDDDGVMR